MNQKLVKKVEILLLVLIAAFVVYGGVKLMQAFLPPGITVSLKQTSVVTQIQSLNRLETASFTIEKIIEAGSEGNVFQKILYGDKILLLAHATVIAGFDLSKLQSSDVSVSGTILHLKLPAPEILVSKLDNEQTKVYDRKLGFLTKGNPGLESEARVQAEASIRQAACDQGILTIASDNAKKQFQATFLTAGFTEVDIQIPVGTCNNLHELAD